MEELNLEYEVLPDGYVIKKDGVPWVIQSEPFIPYPNLGYEGSAQQQIEDLKASTVSVSVEDEVV